MRLAFPEAIARVPFPVWLALIAMIACVRCLWWQFGADDVVFVRNYTQWTGDGLQVDWSAIASDYTGPWGGNHTARYYRPIVSTSLAIDFALFGLMPGVTATLNLVVHVVSSVLVWRLGLAILPGRRAAMIAALLFVTTPLAHENIAWAVGRCGLTNVFGLAAGLALVRAETTSRQGLGRVVPALAFATLDLMTMESATVWMLFPATCVAVRNGFRQHYSGLVRDFVRDAVPFGVLGMLYLGWRILVLGSVTGEMGTGLEGSPLDILSALGSALVGSLAPTDTSFVTGGASRGVFRALAIAPLLLGLIAPLWFRDPRSRGYRRALVLLLLFWALTRLPGLTKLPLGAELDVSRTSYYAYAPLALITGLLAATTLYGRIAAAGLAIMFAFALGHRIDVRADWAEVGRRSRLAAEAAVIEHAKEHECPMGLIDLADGRESAPAVQVGELVLMLAPPFTDGRLPVVSLYGFAPSGEALAGIWLAHELGGAFTIHEPESPHDALRTEWVDMIGVLRDLPIVEAPSLSTGPSGIPKLVAPTWARTEGAVLVLTAGVEQIVVPLSPTSNGEFGDWPDRAIAVLKRWERLGGAGAPFAGHLERRHDPADPATTTARTRAFFGTIGL
ncbi:MAG: hypothetical protein H6834_01215 [Planctomycetes bacterium]|nr:hypothetical protein [Planctomycetota bacterium]